MTIRRLVPADKAAWVELRAALWPDLPLSQLADEIQMISADPQQAAFGCFIEQTLAGFVELSVHPHAVGCELGPVAYLEAWYVREAWRGQSVGRALVNAGEQWGREIGCRELASDTWLDNTGGQLAHQALGFEESSRLIHYRKRL